MKRQQILDFYAVAFSKFDVKNESESILVTSRSNNLSLPASKPSEHVVNVKRHVCDVLEKVSDAWFPVGPSI